MIIGHQQQWSFLEKMAGGGRVPQALLFSVAEGLGKRKIALEFIKLLNCERPLQTPCGRCFSCLNLENKTNPDFLIIEPQGKEIQIGQIRGLQKFLSYTRQLNKFKAALIDNAHCLNQEAQNCLLKTLEEPRGDTILILTTPLPQTLFKTILSRCEQLKFYPVEPKEMEKGFEAYKEHPRWQDILIWSDGRPGLAARFFQQEESVKQHLSDLALIDSLLKGGLLERLLLIKNYWAGLAGAGKDASDEESDNSMEVINDFLETWLFHSRQSLRSEINVGKNDGSMKRLAENLKKIENLKFLLLNSNINKRLLLENLAINL